MQIKVTDTRMHKTHKVHEGMYSVITSNVEIPVSEGTLVLIPHEHYGSPSSRREDPDNILHDYRPIIISETEQIKSGDLYYDRRESYKGIYKAENVTSNFILEREINRPLNHCFKVLALPKHFSPKHLLAISDGKMNSGDKVLVECESVPLPENEINSFENAVASVDMVRDLYEIKLNHNNWITLHKMNKDKFSLLEVKRLMNNFIIAENTFLRERGMSYSEIFDFNDFRDKWIKEKL